MAHFTNKYNKIHRYFFYSATFRHCFWVKYPFNPTQCSLTLPNTQTHTVGPLYKRELMTRKHHREQSTWHSDAELPSAWGKHDAGQQCLHCPASSSVRAWPNSQRWYHFLHIQSSLLQPLLSWVWGLLQLNQGKQYTYVQLYNCPAALQILKSYHAFFVYQARDSRLLGNLPMAHSYGATARRLNIAAVIVGSISLLILIIILSKSFSKVTSS